MQIQKERGKIETTIRPSLQLVPKLVLALGLAVMAAGCSPVSGGGDSQTGPGPDMLVPGDAGLVCTNPLGDEDGDGILNREEGCLQGRDSDKDGTPDWLDLDSDGDGIYDTIEKGEKDASGKCKGASPPKDGWPCDSDGDGLADYLDVDSDNDGIEDGAEDINGDGLLGCCLAQCKKPGWAQNNCKLTADGCGPGQTCLGGKCSPSTALLCSKGETDPKNKDTFADGIEDGKRGTQVCWAWKSGIVPALTQRISTTGNWRLILDEKAKYGELTIANPSTKQAAAVMDYDGKDEEVAGFLVSRELTKTGVAEEAFAIRQAIRGALFSAPGSLRERASGVPGKTHDKYDSMAGITLEVVPASPTTVSALRDSIVAALLSRPLSDLSGLPPAFGHRAFTFIVRLIAVRRTDSGSCCKTKSGLIVLGAVAARDHFDDARRRTAMVADDLTNGTALFLWCCGPLLDCDARAISAPHAADVIWVAEKPKAGRGPRVHAAWDFKHFASQAVSSGLDLRLGVTGMCDPSGPQGKIVGRLCSAPSWQPGHDGGTDRFLTASELTAFSGCLNSPPGNCEGDSFGLEALKAVVQAHLPRAGSAQDRIRSGATLALVLATRTMPASLRPMLDAARANACSLDAVTASKVNTAIAPYAGYLSGAPDAEARALLYVIGGACESSSVCFTEVAHGYRGLARVLGGQGADVCQDSTGLRWTQQVILDDILGAASSLKLDRVPVSASLAVSVDGTVLTRGRGHGFSYNAVHNAVILHNVPMKRGSRVYIGYWGQDYCEHPPC